MNAGEKRAEYERLGKPWPVCDCHDVPQRWKKNSACVDGGMFTCRIRENRVARERRRRRTAAGLCKDCPNPKVTETLCRACADKHANLMSQPYQSTMHALAVSRHMARQAEFQATEVGSAVFAAALERRSTIGTLQRKR